jgi:hypothetical protein
MNRSQKPILDIAALRELGVPWAKGAPVPSQPGVPDPTVGLRPAAGTARPVPAKRLPEQAHHDECEKSLYGGGACTCVLIEQYGLPSEREDSY